MVRIAFLIFFAFTTLVQAQSLPELKFKSYKLNVKGVVESVVTHDLNRDGVDDIIVQTGKELNIFFGQAGGVFKQEPDQTIQLTQDAFLWCVANVGEGLPSIVTNGSKGLYIYRQKNGAFSKPEELITVPNIFKGNASHPPLHIDFMPDLNKDGLSDALLFDKNTVLIFMQDKSGEFRLNQKLDIDMKSNTSWWDYPLYPIENYMTIPFFAVGDVEGSEKLGLAFYLTEERGEKIKEFVQGENNKFNFKEDVSIKLSEKEEHKSGLLSIEIPPIIEDVNGDGILDVIVPYLKSGRIMIYLIKPERRNYSNPDYLIDEKGWIPAIWTKDFYGDGKKELIVSLIEKFKITGAIEAFLSKKLNVQLLAYPFTDVGYPNAPTATIKYSMPFVVAVGKETQITDSVKLAFKPNFDGDFNGDGIKDLILLNMDEKRLEVYYGNKATVIDEKPSAAIEINPPSETDFTDIYVADLNHDGISDVIFKYTSIYTNSSQVEVLVSQK